MADDKDYDDPADRPAHEFGSFASAELEEDDVYENLKPHKD